MSAISAANESASAGAFIKTLTIACIPVTMVGLLLFFSLMRGSGPMPPQLMEKIAYILEGIAITMFVVFHLLWQLALMDSAFHEPVVNRPALITGLVIVLMPALLMIGSYVYGSIQIGHLLPVTVPNAATLKAFTIAQAVAQFVGFHFSIRGVWTYDWIRMALPFLPEKAN